MSIHLVNISKVTQFTKNKLASNSKLRSLIGLYVPISVSVSQYSITWGVEQDGVVYRVFQSQGLAVQLTLKSI